MARKIFEIGLKSGRTIKVLAEKVTFEYSGEDGSINKYKFSGLKSSNKYPMYFNLSEIESIIQYPTLFEKIIGSLMFWV